MSESELAFPYKWWGRFFEAIGPQYGALLSEAMVRAGSRLTGADDDQLASFVAEGRRAAGSLDEDAARLTVRLHDERDQNAALVADLEREAQLILERAPRGWSKRGRVARRQARVDAGARYERAESHRRVAAAAQERIRALGDRVATCLTGLSVTGTFWRGVLPPSSNSTGPIVRSTLCWALQASRLSPPRV